MRIRFYGGRVLTMLPNCDVCQCEVWVDGNRICYVGPEKQSDIKWDREIDLEGNLLMPGYKNAHTHSPMTFLRSFADDLPLSDWLNHQVFPMEAKLNPEDVYHLAKLAILEYLSSGITANFDMYLYPDADAEASIDTGFRTVLCGNIHDSCASPEQMREWYEKWNSRDARIRYRLGFHAEYTCSEPLLREVAKMAEEYHAPVYSHNSESMAEVESCIQKHGTTPTRYLDSLGIFEYGGGGFHCVHMKPEDMAVFQSKGLWAISNPGSNVKLASGIAPLAEMDKIGINLALGTDGPASNNCLDMFREMFLATGLQKIACKDASAMDAEKVLRMATVGGALAMGLTECDVIAEGKLADLLVIDMHRPNMQPENNVMKNLVYSGSKENVKMTVVDGKILYENGCFHIGEDVESIYRKANQITQRLKATV